MSSEGIIIIREREIERETEREREKEGQRDRGKENELWEGRREGCGNGSQTPRQSRHPYKMSLVRVKLN